MPEGVRSFTARMMVTLEPDLVGYALEALLREWFKDRFSAPPVQGTGLASAFLSGGILFPGVVHIYDVK